jgi:hypothetical protein
VRITDPEVIKSVTKGLSIPSPFYAEGKKLQPSFILMSEKGWGKTYTLIHTFPGTMLILSFDNQTEIILEDIIAKEMKQYGKSPTKERVSVINFYPSEYTHIKGSGDERRLDVGYNIIQDVEKLFDNMRNNNIHVDHVVIDCMPALKERINEYMRKCQGLTLREPILGDDLVAYGYRNRFYQVLVSSMFELSDICPVFTTYPKMDLSKAFKGKVPQEPEFEKNLKWDFRNILRIHRVEDEGKKKTSYRYYVVFDSIKGSDFGEQGDEVDVTGGKPAIPAEKFEAYRKNNPMNKVVTPKIEIDPTDTGDDELGTETVKQSTESPEKTEPTQGKPEEKTEKKEKVENPLILDDDL